MTGPVQTVAEVLGVHRWKSMGVTSVKCECGEILYEPDADVTLTSFPADKVFRTHIASAVLKALAGLTEKVTRETAEWLAEIGYPIQISMPDHVPPAAVWSALIDVIHEDADGDWHGNELTREEVSAWMDDEGRGQK